MEAGEKELRQVFEEVTTRNVRAAIDYSKETRNLVRHLEEKVVKLDGIIRSQNETIAELRVLLAGLQTVVFSRGT